MLNTLVYLAWSFDGPVAQKVRQRAAEPMLRALGRGSYEVELSELQACGVGSKPIGPGSARLTARLALP